MTNPFDTLNDLEAKARAVIRDHEPAAMFAFGEACSPDTVLTLITALREAEELITHAVELGHLGEGSTQGWAQDWLAKYAKGEE